MKTLLDLALIRKIQNDPHKYIGQISCQLYSCYVLAYDLFTKLENEDLISEQLKAIPSLPDYIERKYKTKLGSRGWDAPIRYYCQDDRELFDEVLKHIWAYEKLYPTPNNIVISFIPQDNITDLKDLLGSIAARPMMYFGDPTFASFRAFIDGYYDFKTDCNLSLTDFEVKIKSFIDRYRNKKVSKSKYKTWDRNYRWEWDLAVYGINEQHALPHFIKDIEKYTGISLSKSTSQNNLKESTI